jgi:catalase
LATDMALSAARPQFSLTLSRSSPRRRGAKPLLKNSAAIDWVRDAFGHLKVIGHTSAAQPLFAKASLADDLDEGVIELDGRPGVGQYIEAAKQRVWARETRLSESNG